MKAILGISLIVVLNIVLSQSVAIDSDAAIKPFPLEQSRTMEGHPTEEHHNRERREPKRKHDRKIQASIDVQSQKHQGTTVNAQAGGTVYQKGRSQVDVNANYDRRFGGPGGTSKPNVGGRVEYRYNFG